MLLLKTTSQSQQHKVYLIHVKKKQFAKCMYRIEAKLYSLAVISWSSLKGKNLTDVIGKP